LHNSLPINAIYRATEGEGILVGSPQVFVRLQGCSIGCVNCDSKDTWQFDEKFNVSLDEIIGKIEDCSFSGKINRVSITGGDPLHPTNIPGIEELVDQLKAKNYWVNIEASGMRVVDSLFNKVDFIGFDFKTPCTGVRTPFELIEKMARQFPGKFQVKSVIESEQDFKTVLEAKNYIDHLELEKFDWCLTPSYNLLEEFPLERFKKVISLNEEQGGPFRVIGQQHKWIWGPDKKQV